jgi:hypothetical protein
MSISASKGEGVSSTGILTSMKINMEINPEYSDWGSGIDQNQFAILLWISNDNQNVSIANAEIYAALNTEPLQVVLNSPLYGNSDTNNDSLIDEILPGNNIPVLLISEVLSENIVDGSLVVQLLEHNGISSNLELSDVATILFAKNDSGPFKFGQDPFSFPGWEMTSEDIVGYAGTDNMLGILHQAVFTFPGRCFGMAGAAGNYFFRPDSRPYAGSNPFSWVKNSVLEEEISAYDIARIFPNISSAFLNINPSHEINDLEDLLEIHEPAVLTLNKTGANTGHALLATKLTVLENSGNAVIECYDSKATAYTGEVYAAYNYKSRIFDYNGEYDTFRIDEIPNTTQISGDNPISTFNTKASDYLYDTGQKLFTAVSPVDLYVEDSFGRRTGVVEEGTNVNDIPGAELYRIPIDGSPGELVTLVYVPQDDSYIVRINSRNDGLLRFETYTPKAGDYLEFAYLDNIDVTDVWSATYNEEDAESGIRVDSDGDGFINYILALFNQNVPTDINGDYNSNAISGYELYQNYPNPFNPATNIKFDLPEASHVTIRIYDIQGSQVKYLTNNYYTAGSHRVVWDGTNNSGEKINSGIYFYELSAGETRIVKKMQLLK